MVPLYKEMYLGNTSGIQVQNVSGDGREATVTLTYRATNSSAQAVFSHGTPISRLMEWFCGLWRFSG